MPIWGMRTSVKALGPQKRAPCHAHGGSSAALLYCVGIHGHRRPRIEPARSYLIPAHSAANPNSELGCQVHRRAGLDPEWLLFPPETPKTDVTASTCDAQSEKNDAKKTGCSSSNA